MKCVFVICAAVSCSLASSADYPVAFLAYPRTTGWFLTQSVSQVNGQYKYHVGTDLVMAHPDGTETLLVQGSQPGHGMLAVHDFCVDLDGQSIIYSHIRSISGAIGVWCDLYRVQIATGEITRLTDSISEWEPPRGAAQFAVTPPAVVSSTDRVRKGIHFDTVWNIAPCVCGDGSIVFCSTRQNMRAPSEGGWPAFQLFRMDADGAHVTMIGHMNLGGALHPSIMRSGKLLFSSAEQQGGRASKGNGWAIWSINPDGSDWGPEISAIGNATPFHFQTETSDGSLVATQYYDTRILGAIRVAPPFIADPFGPPTKFGNPVLKSLPPLADGPSRVWFSYQRQGFYNAAPWAWINDRENYNAAGEKPGMLSHPAATPHNGILCTWTGDQGDASMNLGVHAIPDISVPATHHSQLVAVVDKPDRHEWMGRPVVSFAAIYGLQNPPVPVGMRADTLPPGSPFGVVSSQSLAWPEIVNPQFGYNNGPDKYANFTLEDAQYLRILSFNKTTNYSAYMFWPGALSHTRHNNAEGFNSAFNERCGTYGEIPLHKYRTPAGTVHYGPGAPDGSTPILDPEGKPDTSFQLEIPANQPWTFQVLNEKKEAVATAQSWHQVIPGEYRTCGGCHTHHGRVPFGMDDSFAASEEYETRRLDTVSVVTWERDVEPIVTEFGLPIPKIGWTGGIPWYKSSQTAVDDDPRLSQSQAETIRTWIDTGMMSGSLFRAYKTPAPPERVAAPEDKLGPYADTQGPTVSHAVFADQIILGLFDPQSGINLSSLVVTCTDTIEGRAAGDNLADLFVAASDHRWVCATVVPQSASLTVSVLDNQVGRNLYGEAVGPGNRTKISFPLTPDVTTPPVVPPPDADAEEIARLQDAIQAIDAHTTELESQRSVLQAQLDALQAGS